MLPPDARVRSQRQPNCLPVSPRRCLDHPSLSPSPHCFAVVGGVRAQVPESNLPTLAGKAVGVVHRETLVAVNHLARRRGVTPFMAASQALLMCPELQLVRSSAFGSALEEVRGGR